MGDKGAGQPAARAIEPPAEPGDGDSSGARIAAHRAEDAAASTAHSVEDWVRLATAPTLLLTPAEHPVAAPASTSRIVAAPATTVEEPPLAGTGAALPPRSMRPMAESVAPAPLRRPPNPRVLKAVFGVIAGCLFIVALAGAKLLYRRWQAPASLPATAGESTLPAVATTALTEPPAIAPENARAAEHPPSAPQSPAPGAGTTATRRIAPARPTPGRAVTKATPRRAPAPKKSVRGTH